MLTMGYASIVIQLCSSGSSSCSNQSSSTLALKSRAQQARAINSDHHPVSSVREGLGSWGAGCEAQWLWECHREQTVLLPPHSKLTTSCMYNWTRWKAQSQCHERNSTWDWALWEYTPLTFVVYHRARPLRAINGEFINIITCSCTYSSVLNNFIFTTWEGLSTAAYPTKYILAILEDMKQLWKTLTALSMQ